jgi:hypothetical protein
MGLKLQIKNDLRIQVNPAVRYLLGFENLATVSSILRSKKALRNGYKTDGLFRSLIRTVAVCKITMDMVVTPKITSP